MVILASSVTGSVPYTRVTDELLTRRPINIRLFAIEIVTKYDTVSLIITNNNNYCHLRWILNFFFFSTQRTFGSVLDSTYEWPSRFICFVPLGTACSLVCYNIYLCTYIYIRIICTRIQRQRIILYIHIRHIIILYNGPASKSRVRGTCTFIITIIIIVKNVRGGRALVLSLFFFLPHTPCVLNTMTYRVVSGRPVYNTHDFVLFDAGLLFAPYYNTPTIVSCTLL